MKLLKRIAKAVGNLGRSIASFFRSLFFPPDADPLRDLDETFAPIDVEEIADRFKLVEEAQRFGSSELPASDDLHVDGPQRRITQYVQDEVGAAFRRANHELERLKQALKGREVDALVGEVERLPEDVRQAIEFDTHEAAKEMTEVVVERDRVESELDTYRQRNDIARNPRLRGAADRRLLLVGTIFLALAQAVANMLFFSQGMAYGLSAGLAFAVVLGILDVILHSLAGRQASRVQAPDLVNRTIGGVLLLTVLFTIPAYNLALVHLRLSVQRLGFAEGTDAWLSSVLGNPLGFTDFGSFMLLVIGVTCSLFAVATGWAWDEPVPELREAGRKLIALREDYDFWEERKLTVGADIRSEAEAELERIHGQVMHNVTMAGALVGRVERLESNLKTFVKDAERACSTLLQKYRDENRLARTTPAPQYFRDEPNLSIEHPLDFDLSAMREFLKKQQQLAERLTQRRPLLHERIMKMERPRSAPTDPKVHV